MSAVEWRYLPGGEVKHALTDSSHAGAICGVYALPASDWRGTGSQVEYEECGRRRECRSCLRRMVQPRPDLSGRERRQAAALLRIAGVS